MTPVLDTLHAELVAADLRSQPLPELVVTADTARSLAGELALMDAYPIPIGSKQAVYENLCAGTVRLFGRPVKVVGHEELKALGFDG